MNERSEAIITLFRAGVRQAEIARRVGCSSAHVAQTLRRYLGWTGAVTPLPPDYHAWLAERARLKNIAPDDLAAELLMFAIDQIRGQE